MNKISTEDFELLSGYHPKMETLRFNRRVIFRLVCALKEADMDKNKASAILGSRIKNVEVSIPLYLKNIKMQEKLFGADNLNSIKEFLNENKTNNFGARAGFDVIEFFNLLIKNKGFFTKTAKQLDLEQNVCFGVFKYILTVKGSFGEFFGLTKRAGPREKSSARATIAKENHHIKTLTHHNPGMFSNCSSIFNFDAKK
jgi:hypothetical protein